MLKRALWSQSVLGVNSGYVIHQLGALEKLLDLSELQFPQL